MNRSVKNAQCALYHAASKVVSLPISEANPTLGCLR
jgi:hypothetical protein